MAETICENPTEQSLLNKSSKDKFILVLNLPYALRTKSKTDPTLDLESLQMSIFGTVLPSITIPPIEMRFMGQAANYSSHSRPNYPPLSVNFVVDNDYTNYFLLWKWLSLLNDPRESKYNGTTSKTRTREELFESGINNEYQTNLSILALDEYNKPAVEIIYYYSFITNLGGINYSYREGETIESTVEFQFSQLDIVKLKK